MSEQMTLREKISGWLRWRRLLASCSYDPSHDPQLEEVGPADFVIAGCPRTGTSLLTAQLFRPPTLVTCMEPWDGLRMPLARLMDSVRNEIASGLMRRGRLDIHALEERRVGWIGEDEAVFPVDTEPGFQLGVKWPAFWRYVPRLKQTRFLVCVRHPVDTVTSFGKAGGRLAEGFDYDVAINKTMNQELRARARNPMVRRAMLWEFVHSRLAPYVDRSNVKVIHYERWLQDPSGVLDEVGGFLGVELEGSNVDLRAPRKPSDLPDVWDAVRRHCSSASAFGYEL